jgi:hypothetical protein
MKSRHVSGLATSSFAITFVLLASACAHQMGKNAAQGATQVLAEGQAATSDDQTRQISRIMAERAVEGAIAALDAPEQRARMQQVVDAAVAQAVATAFRVGGEAAREGVAGVSGEQIALLMGKVARTAVDDALHGLTADLGSRGEGPLAVSLAGTGKNVSAAAVGGALEQLNQLFPGCRGADAVACVNRQIAGMSQSAAIGFAAGLRQTIGWALLIFAGLIGLLMGVLSHWLWSHRAHTGALRTRTT